MIKRTHTPRPAHILPFEEWVAKKYPENGPSRTLLRLIGALDIAYLMYRLQAKVPLEGAKVEKVTKGANVTKVKKVANVTKVAKVAKVQAKPEPVAPEVKVEFHADIEESVRRRKPEPDAQPEPEPLVLEQSEQEPETVKPAAPTGMVWLNDERLEEEDIRRTNISLGVDGISVAFDTRDIDDERETRLTVNGISYVIMLPSPELNLSQMLQIARVTYGELYVLGRMALGAISGEGYITADEAARVVRALHEAGKKTVDLEVAYYTKDKTARSRATSTQRIIFKPV